MEVRTVIIIYFVFLYGDAERLDGRTVFFCMVATDGRLDGRTLHSTDWIKYILM